MEEGIYAVISVSDTGIGMTPEVKARVFEPFFTTKEPGKGTGLGLATTHRIIREAKGAILVYTEFGIGTTFRILLPVSGASPDGDTPEEELDDLRGDETILVVENEKPLQGYIRQVLEHFGYTVLLASDGYEAIRIVEGKTRHIDLVLSDMAMPKQNGIQLGSELARIAPELPVLYMSGHAERFRDIDRDSLIDALYPRLRLLCCNTKPRLKAQVHPKCGFRRGWS